MNENNVKVLIEKEYGIEVKSIIKHKNTFKINGNSGYCFKVLNYEFGHSYYIISAIKHLNNKGFSTVLNIIKTRNGLDYVELNECGYGYLTEWFESRVSNYNDLSELKNVSRELSKLHIASRDFNITPMMTPRIYWFSWINVFKTRKEEIYDFAKRINQKAHKNKFDEVFLKNLNEQIAIADKSIKGLINSNYVEIMERHMLKREFCHHDYANHNILIGKNNEIKIIDFDYCILDSHIHDLASLLIRAMKYNRWDKNKANVILDAYSENIEISKDELNVIKEFIRFPQDFWQRGLQMYWEQQPWGEEFILGKLNKYLEDRKYRDEFIENFFR